MSAETVGVARSENSTEPVVIPGVRSRIASAVRCGNVAEFDRLMADADGAKFAREQAGKASNFRMGLVTLAKKGSKFAKQVLEETSVETPHLKVLSKSKPTTSSAPKSQVKVSLSQSRSGPPPIRPY